MVKKLITREELKYVVYAVVFAFILFTLIIPNVLTKLEGISPFIQFLIFNIGLFVFLNIFLKGSKIDYKHNLGIILLFIALDIFFSPYLVSTTGELNNSVILGSASADYVMGYFWSNFVEGFVLYLFTYVVSPFVLLLISAILLKDIREEL